VAGREGVELGREAVDLVLPVVAIVAVPGELSVDLTSPSALEPAGLRAVVAQQLDAILRLGELLARPVQRVLE
jgi:hypothetical protein